MSVVSARRFQAPQEDGQTLVDPPWEELPALVESNRAIAGTFAYDLDLYSLQELRNAARFSLLIHAGVPREDIAAAIEGSLILSGHQPELFHPGVWFKNFALGALAKRVGGVGVNLVIDNDLCRTASIKVPTGSVDSPRVESVPLDASASPIPFEERGVLDPELLKSFPARVASALGPLVDQPLVAKLWPAVMQSVEETGNLGHAISHARHQLEASWGNKTYEVPMSKVCDASPFIWFMAQVLSRLEDFRAAYNDSLAEYRKAHKIRTPAQPLPDLHQQGDWLEMPFWVWTEEDPTRRPLYARRQDKCVVLSNLVGSEWPLDQWLDDPAYSNWQSLLHLRYRLGIKIRPRALITTLYARLFLADLFLHGIGGAVYDRVTDRIAERFFGFAPPPHATVTATQRLPVRHPMAGPEDLRRIDYLLREMEYHPELFLENDQRASEWIAAKQRWIATPKTRANAAERHQHITQANLQMQPLLEPQRQAARAEQQTQAERLRAAKVLDSREYAFCLFSEGHLRELFDRRTSAEL